MPSWLSAALTLADFVAQRVDRVGPVSFEPIGDQPPERARSIPPQAPPSPRDRPGPASRPDDRDADRRRDDRRRRPEPEASSSVGFDVPRAGGSNDPSSGGSGGGGSEPDEDEEDDTTIARCEARAPASADPPTTDPA